MFYPNVSKVVDMSNSTQVREQYLRCNYTVLIENADFLWVCAKFSKSIQLFANLNIGMIGNETCVKLCEKLINKSETWHILRGNIALTLINQT